MPQFMTPMNPTDEQPSWLSNYLAKPIAESPVSMAVPAPAGFVPNAKNAKATSQGTQSLDKKTTTNTYFSPDEFSQLTDTIRNTPEFQAMGEGDAKLQEMINMAQGMRHPNAGWVAPLAALADSQNPGSNLAATAQRMEQSNPLQTILKYQDELSKRKGDMAKTLLEGVTKLKSGQQSNDLSSKLMMMLGYGGPGSGNANQAGNFLKWHSQLLGDKGVQSANAAMDAADELKSLLEANTSTSVFMAKIATLRSSGLQRITEKELTSMGGSKAAADRLDQALETLKNGDLTEKNSEQMKQAAQILANAAPTILAHKRAQYEAAARGAGLEPGVTSPVLDQAFFRNPPPATQKKTAPPDGHVHIKNDKTGEELYVPQAAVADAAKDGFKEVK